ncbi:hypothetical protein B0H21DRAFT_742874 [Amylocystis lapponica]|nr:hypothetical protein B0H21DRAFT_742874 [Amylocystis lapponica]
MFSLALASLALAAPALALPTRESTGAWCAGLGAGAFDTASNFTLAAHNTTAPAPGAALVLGQAGAIAGAQFGVLSTYASYPYDAWPTFALAAGALLPVPADASAVPASDVPVSAGAQPGWIITSRDPPAPAQIYCAVVRLFVYMLSVLAALLLTPFATCRRARARGARCSRWTATRTGSRCAPSAGRTTLCIGPAPPARSTTMPAAMRCACCSSGRRAGRGVCETAEGLLATVVQGTPGLSAVGGGVWPRVDGRC